MYGMRAGDLANRPSRLRRRSDHPFAQQGPTALSEGAGTFLGGRVTQIYIHNRPVGTAACGQGYMSCAFFCPWCGEVWARLVRAADWTIHTTPCGRHGDRQGYAAIPGSIFTSFNWYNGEDGMEEILLSSPSLLLSELDALSSALKHGAITREPTLC